MKLFLTVAVALAIPAYGYAQSSPKPCEELKSEIAKKLDDKGVKGYTLDVVAKDQEVTEGKVVGTCDGGTKKIVYARKASTPPPGAKEPGKS